MIEAEFLVKTAAGSDEIKARSRKLPPRLRTLLILADGQLNMAQLRQAAHTLGAPGDAVESLVSQGLLAAVAGAEGAAGFRARLRPEAASVAQTGALSPAELSATVDAEVLQTPALSDGDRFRAALKFMNDSAVDSQGLRAFFFTLKLERCFVAADLVALMPAYTKVIAKGSGEDVARVLVARAREILR